MSGNKPNFFIIGAPKCGTTAMSEYLRAHPEICFSEPKEPNFFNTDFSDSYRKYLSKSEYLNDCFSNPAEYKCVGEGTVWYLYSNEAVPNILEYNSSSKFIVMVRNPVRMAHSLHSQKVNSLDENICDFQKAWRLQHCRNRGRRIPTECDDPQMLLYGEICKTGKQLKRLYDQIPRERVHVIIFGDFIKRTKDEYLKVLEFLGLDYDGRTDFPKVNANKDVNRKWKWSIKKIASAVNPKLMPAVKSLKEYFNIEDIGFWNTLRSMGSKETTRKQLNKDFLRELKNYFHNDVLLLSELLNRDLTKWVKD